MSITTFMLLDLPTVSVTLGPAWATQVNEAFDRVDIHDHTSNKGKRIVTAALNIDDDLDMGLNSLDDLHSARYEDLDATLTGAANASSTYVVSGDLYYTNSAGVAVQITDGGSVITTPASVEALSLTDVAADTIIGAGDSFVVYAVDCSVARDITLPLASAVAGGRIYVVIDATQESETNALTLSASGADTINGAATQVLESDGGSWFVVGDGSSKWYII